MRTGASSITGVVLAVGLAACGGGEPAPGGAGSGGDFCASATAAVDSFMATLSEPSGPRYGGVAVVGGLADLGDGLNAFGFSDYVSQQHQAHVVLMTLVRYDRDLTPAPWLARSWEVADSTLTFHLRRDVVWHDGTPTTAHDVAFTFRRVVDPETGFPNAAYWELYDKGPGGVEVVDSYTVRLRVPPHAEMLDPWRVTSIMPRHLLEDVPAAELGRHPFMSRCPVGNGPFRVVEHRREESWTFRRNPAFPRELGGPAELERLVYRVFSEQTTVLTELLTGGIDVYLGASPDHLDQLREADDVRLETFPWRRYTFVAWNTRRPHLGDPAVRRALATAVDRQELVDGALGGQGEVINSSVPPFHWAYDPAVADELSYDPREARRLLDEAGWSDRDDDGVREDAEGRELRIEILTNRGNQLRQDVAETVQADLAAVGVDARVQLLEFNSLAARIMDPGSRDFDAFVLAYSPDFKLDDTDLFHSGRAGQALGWAGIRDPRLDRLLDTLQTVPDRDAARPLWREYQRLVAELQPFLFMYAGVRATAVSDRLRGVVMDARGEYLSVQDWWIPEEERRR